MTTPRLKHFTVTTRNPDENASETRLVKAQTQAQVVAMLKREALKTVEDFKVEPASQDELIELSKLGIEVETVAE